MRASRSLDCHLFIAPDNQIMIYMSDNRNAISAVIYSGVAMQFVGVAMLAIPHLAFDASNPLVVFPAYIIAFVIIGIGTGITLTGARNAIRIAKQAGMPTNVSGERMAAVGGPNIIRPVLAKKGKSETPAMTKVASVIPSQAPQLAKPAAPVESMVPSSSGPADPESIKAALNTISERYNKPDVRSKFDGWVNTLVISFLDINKAYVFKINGSDGIEMSEGFDEAATIQVSMASDMFVKLLSTQINAIKAYSSGALKVKGEMKNLLKLRKLMF